MMLVTIMITGAVHIYSQNCKCSDKTMIVVFLQQRFVPVSQLSLPGAALSSVTPLEANYPVQNQFWGKK